MLDSQVKGGCIRKGAEDGKGRRLRDLAVVFVAAVLAVMAAAGGGAKRAALSSALLGRGDASFVAMNRDVDKLKVERDAERVKRDFEALQKLQAAGGIADTMRSSALAARGASAATQPGVIGANALLVGSGYTPRDVDALHRQYRARHDMQRALDAQVSADVLAAFKPLERELAKQQSEIESLERIRLREGSAGGSPGGAGASQMHFSIPGPISIDHLKLPAGPYSLTLGSSDMQAPAPSAPVGPTGTASEKQDRTAVTAATAHLLKKLKLLEREQQRVDTAKEKSARAQQAVTEARHDALDALAKEAAGATVAGQHSASMGAPSDPLDAVVDKVLTGAEDKSGSRSGDGQEGSVGRAVTKADPATRTEEGAHVAGGLKLLPEGFPMKKQVHARLEELSALGESQPKPHLWHTAVWRNGEKVARTGQPQHSRTAKASVFHHFLAHGAPTAGGGTVAKMIDGMVHAETADANAGDATRSLRAETAARGLAGEYGKYGEASHLTADERAFAARTLGHPRADLHHAKHAIHPQARTRRRDELASAAPSSTPAGSGAHHHGVSGKSAKRLLVRDEKRLKVALDKVAAAERRDQEGRLLSALAAAPNRRSVRREAASRRAAVVAAKQSVARARRHLRQDKSLLAELGHITFGS